MTRSEKRMGAPILRLALTTTLVMVTLYGICWVAAAFFDLPFAHAFLDVVALAEKEGVWGVAILAVAGSLLGALFAILYNLTSFVDEIALSGSKRF